MILFVFLYFMKAVKSRFLEEWSELVASQLTQISTYAIKRKWEKTIVGKVVFT